MVHSACESESPESAFPRILSKESVGSLSRSTSSRRSSRADSSSCFATSDVETVWPLLRNMIFLKVSSLERSASEMRMEITGCCGLDVFSAMGSFRVIQSINM